MSVNTPHDRLFQFAFEDLDVARGELEAVLPEALRRELDLEALRVEATRFVEEDLSARFCDVLYRAPVRGGGEAFLWVLLEHQSSDDPMMGLRLLEYMVRTWSRLRRAESPRPIRLPMIVPIVLQHDPAGWRTPKQFRRLYAGPEVLVDALHELVPDFTYILDDLSQSDDETIANRAESPFLRLVLWSLRSRGVVDSGQKAAWVAAMRALWVAGKHDAALAIVRYHVEVSEEDAPVPLQAAREADPDLERSAMTLMEKLRTEGEVIGEAKTLLKQITLKFGEPSEATVERVQAAPKDELDRWIERILTASTLDDLFAD